MTLWSYVSRRYVFTLQRTRPPLGLCLPKSVLCFRIDYRLSCGCAFLPCLVHLASLMCAMNWRPICRFWFLHSRVADSISRGGDHGMHCWWRSNKVETVVQCSVCRMWVFAGFSGNPCEQHGIMMMMTHEWIDCR